MNTQKDLEGNETGITKDIIERQTIKYLAAVFTVSVSEAGQDQLDKIHEEKNSAGLRRWIAKNMKVRDSNLLRQGEEGAAFQSDLEKLLKVL